MVSLLSSPFQFECMHCTQTNASTTHVQVLVASDCNGDWKRHSWLALNRPIKKGSWCNDGTMVAIKNDELIEVDVWCGLIFIWYRMSASASIWCPGRNTISCASSAREATVDWMSFQANLHSNIGNSNRTDYMSGGCIAIHSLSLNWLLVGLVFTLLQDSANSISGNACDIGSCRDGRQARWRPDAKGTAVLVRFTIRIFTNIIWSFFWIRGYPWPHGKKGMQYLLEFQLYSFVKWNSQVSSYCTSMRWLTSVSQLLSAKVSHHERAAKRWGVEIYNQWYSMLVMYSIHEYYSNMIKYDYDIILWYKSRLMSLEADSLHLRVWSKWAISRVGRECFRWSDTNINYQHNKPTKLALSDSVDTRSKHLLSNVIVMYIQHTSTTESCREGWMSGWGGFHSWPWLATLSGQL